MVVLTAPKTTGAYVPAELAECISSEVCGALDIVWTTSATFTATTLEADWVMESRTVAWRMNKGVGEGSPSVWGPLTWEELPDGSVKTDAMLRGQTEVLRWVPERLEALAAQWSKRYTDAHLTRLAGRWGVDGCDLRTITAGGHTLTLRKAEHERLANEGR